MRPSITIVFSILFLMVLGVYWKLGLGFQKVSLPGGLSKPGAEGRVLVLEEGDTITRIEIQKTEERETITLEKEDGQWMLKYPVIYPADPLIVRGLTAALAASSKLGRLKPEKSWEEYGLAKPSLKIGIETEKNPVRRFLSFGAPAPAGDRVFARWGEGPEYFLVSTDIKKSFERTVYSLRLKKIFYTPAKDISKVHVRMESGDYEIAKHNGKWFWMEPIPILGEFIETPQVEELLKKIQSLYVKEFVDEKVPNQSEAGFTMLGQSVKIWGAQDRSEALDLGREELAKNAVYARRAQSDAVFFVSQNYMEDLFIQMKSLADTEVLDQAQRQDLFGQLSQSPKQGTVR